MSDQGSGIRASVIAAREAADRRYNAALTALDAARPTPGGHAAGPLPIQLDAAAIRERAIILPPSAPDLPGWRGRLARFVWRIAGPVFTRQQAMNDAVAGYAARTEAGLEELRGLLCDQRDADRRHAEALRTFESRLVQFLQQITPFVDTKLRVLEAALEDLRLTATAAQRTAVAARRELERQASGIEREEPEPGGAASSAGSVPSASPNAAAGASYVGFEDIYRGTPEAVRSRQQEYAQRFAGASDVLDVGCGRGELLELLREQGVRARGIDVNPEMVGECRARGLDAVHADALDYLQRLPDASLGGLIAAQVVEHLEPGYLMRFIEAAHAKVRPGSAIILETVNVACWLAFFEGYLRDITHVRPLHPDTLKFLVVAAGFEDADVHFRSPVEASGRLQRIAPDDLPPALAPVVEAVNANVDRLNERLFTHLDYAVIAVRGR